MGQENEAKSGPVACAQIYFAVSRDEDRKQRQKKKRKRSVGCANAPTHES